MHLKPSNRIMAVLLRYMGVHNSTFIDEEARATQLEKWFVCRQGQLWHY